jgi:GDPmannose 4,6-dehydratase
MPTSQRTALICGISGQDGTYLAEFLLQKGYRVVGTSRRRSTDATTNLRQLHIDDQVQLLEMAPENVQSVQDVLKHSNPDEIYYLAGQSSVGQSFSHPFDTVQSISLGALNILEACRTDHPEVKMFFAGSGECFGETGHIPANEQTAFNPQSPYAVAKASAFWLTQCYRQNYGLYACTGILFNHESPLRAEQFVTQKIIQAVRRIATGSKEKMRLGRLDIARDWGWASEYVEAMWLMLQQSIPTDFVIATGTSLTLEEFTRIAFEQANLDWKLHVIQDASLFRLSDFAYSAADPSKAYSELGWKAKLQGAALIKKMYHSTAV